MSEQEVQYTPDRSVSRARFLARFHRYRNLFLGKWWVLPLGVAAGVLAMALVPRLQAPAFTSSGRMIVSIKLTIPEGSVYTEELSQFVGTQAALMQSAVVVNRARARVAAQEAALPPRETALRVSVQPKTTIFLLHATSQDPRYAQAFLQAVMEEYINLKKEMRSQTSDTTVAGLTEEVLKLEKDLRKADEELVGFQSTNSVVLLQEQGNSVGNYLAALNTRLAVLKSEYELLRTLTLEQNLERRQQGSGNLPGDPGDKPGNSMDADYMKARQQILLLKAEQEDAARYLRPKHPKMLAMSEEIARRERLLEIYRQQTAEQLENRKSSLALQITHLEKDVSEWDAKALEVSRRSAEFARLKANSQRIQALYDRLVATMQTLDVNKDISPESVTLMEPASEALIDQPELKKQLITGAVVGLAFAIALLLVVDRLDDRMGSSTEVHDHFEENVLAQIPREKPSSRKGPVALLGPEDQRHSFVEAYRNLRSSLFFLNEDGARHKTLLVTSSVPNEGKSLTAANLAVTLAQSGSTVLLVDADLRKGSLHNWLQLDAQPGLTEVFAEGQPWREAVRATAYPRLSLLSRGATTQRSSEFFLGPVTRTLLKEASAEYDVVVLDTAPVMAADDVTSLAPLVDGVVFVLRAEHTSARVARAALDALYQRQVNILGLVFNAVRPTSSDYYYYYKYKDYYASHVSSSASGRGRRERNSSRSTAPADKTDAIRTDA
jgi:capsular exopolysaccharide synthesis family protein